MSDRLDEIKARVGQAHKAVILDQPWTEPQRLDWLEASYTFVHKDIPWLIDRLYVAESNFNMADVVMRRQDAEIERLRAALKQMDIGCTEAREFGPEFACTLLDTADDWCLACLAHAALADQGGES